MAIEDWDVECHTCHVRTDERGIQIIHSGGETTIDYPELDEIEQQSLDWWRVTARRAYLWGVTLLVVVLFGGLMTALTQFSPQILVVYLGACCLLAVPAFRQGLTTFRAYQQEIKGSRLRLITTENEAFVVTRRDGWPSGFEQLLLARAGG